MSGSNSGKASTYKKLGVIFFSLHAAPKTFRIFFSTHKRSSQRYAQPNRAKRRTLRPSATIRPRTIPSAAASGHPRNPHRRTMKDKKRDLHLFPPPISLASNSLWVNRSCELRDIKFLRTAMTVVPWRHETLSYCIWQRCVFYYIWLLTFMIVVQYNKVKLLFTTDSISQQRQSRCGWITHFSTTLKINFEAGVGVTDTVRAKNLLEACIAKESWTTPLDWAKIKKHSVGKVYCLHLCLTQEMKKA